MEAPRRSASSSKTKLSYYICRSPKAWWASSESSSSPPPSKSPTPWAPWPSNGVLHHWWGELPTAQAWHIQHLE
jgi:hypothetical protein